MSTNPLFSSVSNTSRKNQGETMASNYRASRLGGKKQQNPPVVDLTAEPPDKKRRTGSEDRSRAAHASGFDRTGENISDSLWEDDNDFFTEDVFEKIDYVASQAYTKETDTDTHVNMHTTRGTERKTAFTLDAENNWGNLNATLDEKSISEGYHSAAAGEPAQQPTSAHPKLSVVDQNKNDNRWALQQELSKLKKENSLLSKKVNQMEENQYSKDGQIRMLKDSIARKENDIIKLQTDLSNTKRTEAKEQAEKEKLLREKIEKINTELQFKEQELFQMKESFKRLQQNKVEFSQTLKSPKVERSRKETKSPLKSDFPTNNSFMETPKPGPSTSLKRCDSCVNMKTPRGAHGVGEVKTKSSKKKSRFKVQYSKGYVTGSHLLSKMVPVDDKLGGQSAIFSLMQPPCDGCDKDSDSEGNKEHVVPEETEEMIKAREFAVKGIQNLLSSDGLLYLQSNLLNSGTSDALYILPIIEVTLRNYETYLNVLSNRETPSSGSRLAAEESMESLTNDVKKVSLQNKEDKTILALKILQKLVIYSPEVRQSLLMDDILQFEGVTDLKKDTLKNMLSHVNCLELFKITLRLSLQSTPEGPSIPNTVVNNALLVLVKLSQLSKPEWKERFSTAFESNLFSKNFTKLAEPVILFPSLDLFIGLATTHKELYCTKTKTCPLMAFLVVCVRRPNSIPVMNKMLDVIACLSRHISPTGDDTQPFWQPGCSCGHELSRCVAQVLYRQLLNEKSSPLRERFTLMRKGVFILHYLTIIDRHFYDNFEQTPDSTSIAPQYLAFTKYMRYKYSKMSNSPANEVTIIEELLDFDDLENPDQLPEQESANMDTS